MAHLATPEGRPMLLELRAAREWKVRPSEFRKWSLRDKLAAIALMEHEGDIGPCGLPHSQTQGDLEGWFEIHDEAVCWACAALDEYKTNAEKHGWQPGVQLRVIDTRNLSEE